MFWKSLFATKPPALGLIYFHFSCLANSIAASGHNQCRKNSCHFHGLDFQFAIASKYPSHIQLKAHPGLEKNALDEPF